MEGGINSIIDNINSYRQGQKDLIVRAITAIVIERYHAIDESISEQELEKKVNDDVIQGNRVQKALLRKLLKKKGINTLTELMAHYISEAITKRNLSIDTDLRKDLPKLGVKTDFRPLEKNVMVRELVGIWNNKNDTKARRKIAKRAVFDLRDLEETRINYRDVFEEVIELFPEIERSKLKRILSTLNTEVAQNHINDMANDMVIEERERLKRG